MRSIKAVIIAALLLQPAAVSAAEQMRRLAHYTHQRWTEEGQAPAPVVAMAQDLNGYLWLATGVGLFRFDGITFEPIAAERGEEQHDLPSALLATRKGDIWISYAQSRRFAVYRNGVLRVLDMPPAPDRVVTMAEGKDGAIWALTAKFNAELLRLGERGWRAFDAAQGLPRDDALSLLVAADGGVWVSQSNSVARLRPGAGRFEVVRKTPRANGVLSQDPAGRVWLSEKSGSYPLTGPGAQGPPTPGLVYRTDDAQIRGAPMFDRSGNLWIATRYAGLQRVAAAAAPPLPARRRPIESLRARDGLSSDLTNQVFEDREGDVWVGSEKGLDKLRPATLRSEPLLTRPAAFGDKLLAASNGSVYIGQADAIYRVLPGGVPTPILRGVHEPQSLCEAPDGALWIAFATRIVVLRDGRAPRTFERPDTDSIVYDCAFDTRGDYWISAAAGGLLRYRRGRWEAMFKQPDGDRFHPMTMVRDGMGRLVIQWAPRRLAWLDGSEPTFAPLELGRDATALTLYPTSDGDVLAAGAFGLARFHDRRVDTIRADPSTARGRISGVVQTSEGDTWLAYPRALVRVGSAELERAFGNHASASPDLSLGFGDGLTSRPHSHTQRSLVQGGDGRLWVATETGTLWMNPRRIARTHLPPGVTIRSVTADRLYRDPLTLRLPKATSSVEIDYAVLSFADPRQVRVRYKLEGFDKDWIDPGARRQAFYTNLKPGRYRFQVIAASNEEVWNRTGAAVVFDIPPTFLQSRWFVALCVLVTMALFWLFYRLRLAQLEQRIHVGHEARLSERERIARELHDTLLQSVQGLVLRFQSIANKMPPEEPAKGLLESALKRADDVIVDGRNRVRDLRTAESPGDLTAILEERGRAAGFDPPVPVHVATEGVARAVHPLVAAEIGRIAGEALFNAARHAKARTVDLTLHFADHQLSLRISDDGVGLPGEIVAKGHKPGHFGLLGMRERAQRIGGALSVENRPGGGVEIIVKVPARLAYADKGSAGSRLSAFLRLFGRAPVA